MTIRLLIVMESEPLPGQNGRHGIDAHKSSPRTGPGRILATKQLVQRRVQLARQHNGDAEARVQ